MSTRLACPETGCNYICKNACPGYSSATILWLIVMISGKHVRTFQKFPHVLGQLIIAKCCDKPYFGPQLPQCCSNIGWGTPRVRSPAIQQHMISCANKSGSSNTWYLAQISLISQGPGFSVFTHEGGGTVLAGKAISPDCSLANLEGFLYPSLILVKHRLGRSTPLELWEEPI